LKAKFTNKINYNTNNSNTKLDYLEKVTSNICRPINPITYNSYRYFITFLDKATCYLDIQLIRTKDKVFSCFNIFKLQEENNKTNKRIRIYSTNNSTEFVNKRFKTLLNNSSIIH
jgi:fibronectin type 3 domain-containing protein